MQELTDIDGVLLNLITTFLSDATNLVTGDVIYNDSLGNSLGLYVTPRMIRKKNGSLFCLLRMESVNNSLIIGLGVGIELLYLLTFYLTNTSILSVESLILFLLTIGSTFLIYCYFNYSGMYITKKKSVLYQNYLITFKINMSKVQGIFIVDATT